LWLAGGEALDAGGLGARGWARGRLSTSFGLHGP
jgi:hypothetical protein